MLTLRESICSLLINRFDGHGYDGSGHVYRLLERKKGHIKVIQLLQNQL